jgi:SAM-dependent methyltransferase
MAEAVGAAGRGQRGFADDQPSVLRRFARSLVPGRLRPGLFGAARALRHRGDAVHCPCCDGHFDSFIPHRGVAPGRCPRCGSLERHRLLIGYLRECTDLFVARLSVLHIAPEYYLQRRLRPAANLTYRSADLDSPLAMDRVDLLDMPYPAGSFDVVICNHVLEHVPDDRLALSEIHRVLRPHGRAILTSPVDDTLAETLEDSTVTSPEERHLVFGQSDHLRRYGRDFAERVAASGFAVATVSYIDQVDPREVVRCGLRRESDLFPNDDIFICRRTELVTERLSGVRAAGSRPAMVTSRAG